MWSGAASANRSPSATVARPGRGGQPVADVAGEARRLHRRRGEGPRDGPRRRSRSRRRVGVASPLATPFAAPSVLRSHPARQLRRGGGTAVGRRVRHPRHSWPTTVRAGLRGEWFTTSERIEDPGRLPGPRGDHADVRRRSRPTPRPWPSSATRPPSTARARRRGACSRRPARRSPRRSAATRSRSSSPRAAPRRSTSASRG